MKTLYYECHVTIEPILDEAKLQRIKLLAREHQFKVADLLMVKRPTDTPQRSSKDTFMTGHSDEYHLLENRMKGLIRCIKSEGIKVWRYKIETVPLDSRVSGDTLGLLT